MSVVKMDIMRDIRTSKKSTCLNTSRIYRVHMSYGIVPLICESCDIMMDSCCKDGYVATRWIPVVKMIFILEKGEHVSRLATSHIICIESIYRVQMSYGVVPLVNRLISRVSLHLYLYMPPF